MKLWFTILCLPLYLTAVAQPETGHRLFIDPSGNEPAVLEGQTKLDFPKNRLHFEKFSLVNNYDCESSFFYPIVNQSEYAGQLFGQYICRILADQLPNETEHPRNPVMLTADRYLPVDPDKQQKVNYDFERFYFGNQYNFYDPNHALEIITDATQFTEAKARWRAQFKAFLLEQMQNNEDHELEYLLYLREFAQLPKIEAQRQSTDWKKDELAKFIFSISGLNDITDAIPMNAGQFAHHDPTRNLPVPAAIQLPAIESPDGELTAQQSPAANVIPRSCYYLEFDSVKALINGLLLADQEWQRWSPNTYPKSIEQLLTEYLQKLGLSEAFLIENREQIQSITLAGWDPYFQSGTNLLVVLEWKSATFPAVNHPLQFQTANLLVLSTGHKLLEMARDCQTNGQTMRNVKNFRYARARLKQTADEQEQCFLYLSDYWLMNFISPRWRVHSRRRLITDARIRFARLLQMTELQENGEQPTLATLKAKYANNQPITWLLSGLVLEEGQIMDPEIGGLFNHRPIDELPFEKVNTDEARYYERFAINYRGRWEQVDPLALQISLTEKQTKARLYISPISRRSFYRDLRRVTLKEKQPHQKPVGAEFAAGFSAVFHSEPLKGLMYGVPLPMVLQPSANIYDFGLPIENPQAYTAEKPELDYFTATGLPIALELPTPIVQAGIRMLGLAPDTSHNFEGLTAYLHKQYKLWELTGKHGQSFISYTPPTLSRLRKELGDHQLEPTPVASDLHGFVNLNQAPMLRNTLHLYGAKNRALAAWRRESRQFRIQRLFGRTNSSANPIELPEWTFPKSMENFKQLAECNPFELGLRPKNLRASSAMNFLQKLPQSIYHLEQLAFYASVENNALYFEFHLDNPILNQHLQKPLLPENSVPANRPTLRDLIPLDFR